MSVCGPQTKFFRRQSWVHHQGVSIGHGFVRIGQDFVCVGPHFVRGPSGVLRKTSERCPYVVRGQQLVRRPSWVHHKDVRMGQGFVRIGQDFALVGQHIVRKGQGFVRVGQHFVRGPSGVLKKTSERCPYVVRGQELVRRPSWVHHKDVRMEQGFVRIGQGFVRIGQHFVRMGQDLVRVGQEFVRGPSGMLQKTSKRCQIMVLGQNFLCRPSWAHHKDARMGKGFKTQ